MKAVTYNPFDGKPPQTLGQAITQNYLGQHGINTGNNEANQAGREDRKRRKKREEEEQNEKHWWQW